MSEQQAIRLLDLRAKQLSAIEINNLIPRAALDITAAVEQVKPLLADVRARGVAAIVDATEKFDGVNPEPIRVSKSELQKALDGLSIELRKAIEQSINRVRKVSEASLPKSTTTNLAEGAVVHQRWQAIDSVGLYVPGGKAVYPSSVVMNVVPAQVSGVARLAIATPAQAAFGGRPHPTVLATAALLGVEDVFCMGGPAAIAAFAYGLPQIEFDPVDLVTGPGNIYVAAAKRALRGTIGIDSEAGTTEIMVIADESADARLIAFDLVSQAEHDEAAAAVLVTDSTKLANAVIEQLPAVIAATAHRDRVATALAGQQSAVVLVDSEAAAVAIANAYATEHLEILTADPKRTLQNISSAGAIFLGANSPVSLGDYMAGSNHVLPTGGQAKFGSGLGVHTFLRAQQVIDYDQSGLQAVAELISGFAEAEGLPAHGDAVQARFQ